MVVESESTLDDSTEPFAPAKSSSLAFSFVMIP